MLLVITMIVHILAIVIYLGGTFFMDLLIVPALNRIPPAVADEEHLQLHHWRIQHYTTGPEMEQRVLTAARLGFSYWLMLFDTIALRISLSTPERQVLSAPQ